MPVKTTLLSLLILIGLVTACKKDFSDRKCQELKTNMSVDNINEVKRLVTELISKLPSDDYNEKNVTALATRLSGECGVTANVLCFSCIQTLPEQTEIQLIFSYAGTSYNKIFDISYSVTNNKMKIVNMHN